MWPMPNAHGRIGCILGGIRSGNGSPGLGALADGPLGTGGRPSAPSVAARGMRMPEPAGRSLRSAPPRSRTVFCAIPFRVARRAGAAPRPPTTNAGKANALSPAVRPRSDVLPFLPRLARGTGPRRRRGKAWFRFAAPAATAFPAFCLAGPEPYRALRPVPVCCKCRETAKAQGARHARQSIGPEAMGETQSGPGQSASAFARQACLGRGQKQSARPLPARSPEAVPCRGVPLCRQQAEGKAGDLPADFGPAAWSVGRLMAPSPDFPPGGRACPPSGQARGLRRIRSRSLQSPLDRRALADGRGSRGGGLSVSVLAMQSRGRAKGVELAGRRMAGGARAQPAVTARRSAGNVPVMRRNAAASVPPEAAA